MGSFDHSSEVLLVTDDYGNLVECHVKKVTDDYGNEVGSEWAAMRSECPKSGARIE